ncbi:hypothetical protein EVAR_48501_1 [Eumeta japonica]|uniref:Uncharacterized protein n=1 Tax=Eumeta variegata TaxID=151549 RepID=A0A4C1XFX5_EUMVA|nr:hypothetical protein EVAR_48501_1 [Eumeta japonica]
MRRYVSFRGRDHRTRPRISNGPRGGRAAAGRRTRGGRAERPHRILNTFSEPTRGLRDHGGARTFSRERGRERTRETALKEAHKATYGAHSLTNGRRYVGRSL